MSIFNDTKIAFAEKSTAQLEKAKWMFTAIKYPSLTNVGINVLNFTIKNNFPLVTDLVKTTLFEQFCGGETREQSMKVVDKDRKSTRLNSSHLKLSRMPSSA